LPVKQIRAFAARATWKDDIGNRVSDFFGQFGERGGLADSSSSLLTNPPFFFLSHFQILQAPPRRPAEPIKVVFWSSATSPFFTKVLPLPFLFLFRAHIFQFFL